MFLGIYGIDEYVPIPSVTHRFSSGAAYAPTAITYSIYEEGKTPGLDEDVDMTPASPFDSVTGFYYARRQLTAAAGFENNKTYVVLVKATVDSVAAIESHVFQIRPLQTGDSYAIVNHADYGNAHLVRSTIPGNTLSVDANHLVAVPSTQDVNVKTVTNGAISNATFNADVGSTAYATNIIALAVRKVLDELKLDHLIAVAESDDPVDNSIIAKLAATGGDWSTFVGSTDSLQGIRDRGDAAWVTAKGFAVAGDEMKLEDDAITAAKFDESTAFPLKAADTGATILARAGDEMDLVDAPNETAVTAIQNGLSTFDYTSDGVTLTTGGIDAIFDRNSSLSISFETLINRIYQMLNDKMEITDATGAVSLKDIAGTGEIATGNVSDDSTTTTRDGLTWA